MVLVSCTESEWTNDHLGTYVHDVFRIGNTKSTTIIDPNVRVN